MTEKVCMTSGDRSGVMVEFPCPECGETVVRSQHVRSINAPYKCVKCGFEGP